MKIPPAEIKFSGLSTGDEIGRVFYWRNGVYRGIYKNKVEPVRSLFNTGLINALIKEKLMPDTRVTDYTHDEFALVIEHDKIETVTYPFEWSFEMLKDAALVVLKVNAIAQQFGYQTKDCHPYNILFVGTIPMYIDFGSFVRTETNKNHLLCYDEFLRSYEYLFYIAKTNEYHWVRQLSTTGLLISHESFFLYRYSFLRNLGLRTLQKIVAAWRFLHIDDGSYDEKIKKKLAGLGSFILHLKKQRIFPFRIKTIPQLEARIHKAKKLGYKTMWGEYQNNFDETNARFNRILDIIREYDIKTVFEVAGNQGFFANMLLQKGGIQRVFCSDYDENAVDAMHIRYKNNEKLSPVLMNFLFPNHTSFTQPAHERFNSNIVVALAVSHHILLTQKQNVDLFFHSLAGYTNQYIAVEFMPMGLWDSVTNTAPPIPDWYTFEWFKEHFEKFFTLIQFEEVAKNRVLLFGKLIE